VSRQQAQAELQTFYQARLHTAVPEIVFYYKSIQVTVEPLQRLIAIDSRKPHFILLACVPAVLFIACANVANLQLARAMKRHFAAHSAHRACASSASSPSRVSFSPRSPQPSALGLVIAIIITALVRHRRHARFVTAISNLATAAASIWQIERHNSDQRMGARLHHRPRPCHYAALRPRARHQRLASRSPHRSPVRSHAPDPGARAAPPPPQSARHRSRAHCPAPRLSRAACSQFRQCHAFTNPVSIIPVPSPELHFWPVRGTTRPTSRNRNHNQYGASSPT
jgi:hypothetical protein